MGEGRGRFEISADFPFPRNRDFLDGAGLMVGYFDYGMVLGVGWGGLADLLWPVKGSGEMGRIRWLI